MAQQKRKEITRNQQPEAPNIIAQVVLKPEAEEIWLTALADISRSVRMQKGGATYLVKMAEESAYAQPSGVLTLTTMVDGEKVEMDVPPGMWEKAPPNGAATV